MKNYRIMILCSLIIAVCTSCASSKSAGTAQASGAVADAVNLDAAIGDFSHYVSARNLPEGSYTAVAVPKTPVQRLGNYIVDKISESLVNNTSLRMVSRQDFERVISEQNIQLSGNFSDDSSARIGQNLGWRTIIFGAVEPLQDAYHLSLRAVDVETGELKGSKSYTLNGGDPVLINLINPGISVQRLTEREMILQPFNGSRNNFNLTVTANKTIYYDNEELFITLRASENCYFVVYHLDIENNMQVIFPNFWERDNNVLKANVARTIPDDSSFSLHAPYGEERILVYASLRPFTISEDQYSAKPITQEMLASPQALWRIDTSSEGSKALSVTPRGATAQISYTILPR